MGSRNRDLISERYPMFAPKKTFKPIENAALQREPSLERPLEKAEAKLIGYVQQSDRSLVIKKENKVTP